MKSSRKWYRHEQESVTKNNESKIIWDYTIQCASLVNAWRPDIVVVDNKKITSRSLISRDAPIDDKAL